jgi:3-hydroxyacyl-CoA dehydrogenase / enoyl-CoA hydratase / 3-hydroxybutyryl-CoA epimerase
MATTWHQDSIEGGILRVRIDQEGRSVNAFSVAVLDELAQLISTVRQDPTIRGVVFKSGKGGTFIVGADVNELKDLRSAETARAMSQKGQKVFKDLSELPVPTVALISGSCLGGGLEFSMACTYRVADDDRRTLLGLPEVLLGLIPGWGGTVRLPRLVGLEDALGMILTGEMVNGRQAKSKGLVHDVVPTEAFDHVGEEIIRRHPVDSGSLSAAKHTKAKPVFAPPRRPLRKRLSQINSLTRKLAINIAEKRVQARAHGHYPALKKAIDVIRAGMLVSPDAGFAAESSAIAELAEHPVTTELMRLFFLREDAKTPPSDLKLPVKPESVQHAAVIGAGAMGAGVARILAEKGVWVRLKDIKPEFVARGMDIIRKMAKADVSRRRATARQAEMTLDHISPTTDYRGLKNADIVIEAVLEDVAIKQQVFRELADATGPRTVLATNTSSLLVKDIAAGVAHPERIAGLHFFNPPHQMRLVEVIRTHQTSPEALATALAVVQRLGKTAIVVSDCAGFLVNRLLTPYMNEVGYLLTEVADAMEIERAAIEFGKPMGPLELTDLVGIDVAAHVAQNMHKAYGSRMEPAPIWTKLEELRRTQKGVTGKLITKSLGGKRRLDPRVARVIKQLRSEQGKGTGPLTQEAIIERLVYPVINEAARCLEEKIVEKPDHIDLAMVFGTGFAPFRGGPLRYADSVGVSKIVATLEELARVHPRLAPCEALRRRAAERHPFLKSSPELRSAVA